MTLDDIRWTPTFRKILDDMEESNPFSGEEWSVMVARRMARLPQEKLERRKYYDLFEFRCR